MAFRLLQAAHCNAVRMLIETAGCQPSQQSSIARCGALWAAAGCGRQAQQAPALICRLLSTVPSSAEASAAAEPSQQHEDRRQSGTGASSSASSSPASPQSSRGAPHESRGKQRFTSAYPFGGTRQPPSPRPHAGGPTPDQVSAQMGPPQVSRLDKVRGRYQVARKPVFAVVELGPTQFKVSPGDLVVSEKLRDVDVNDRVKLGRVLMLGSRHETIIGRPLVPNASVTAVIEEQFQDAKVLIFHKRRRKNSRRLKGHRQELTSLRIMDIVGIEASPMSAAAHVSATEEAA